MRDWAAALIADQLGLDAPHDILRAEHRGRRNLGDTEWTYRTHGVGVDVVHKDGRGGIDFDFGFLPEKEFADPDSWRLRLFAERAIHAGKLPADIFRPLLADEDAFWALADSTLKEMYPA